MLFTRAKVLKAGSLLAAGLALGLLLGRAAPDAHEPAPVVQAPPPVLPPVGTSPEPRPPQPNPALLARVAELEERVAQLEALEPATEDPGEAPHSTRSPARGRDGRPDFEALLGAGFGEREVRAYRERLDEIELERLSMQDRARREGWNSTSRYREATRDYVASLASIRDEVGEPLYDWGLYTSGQNNRVRVSHVLAGSAAELAGIESGDVIERYAEEQVFRANELQELTRTGYGGETTAIDVLRNGQRLRVYTPRGPLGVTLVADRLQPAPPS